VSYRRNHTEPTTVVLSPDEIFEFLLVCSPDDDPIHGKLAVFLSGNHARRVKSKSLRQEVKKLSRRPITQEAMVNCVLDKVVEIYRPESATVRGDFDTGEGLRISIEVAYGDRPRRAIENSHLQWKRG
jgi:NADPH-dependent 7-cyano-7-deazaguanine reductase QueF